jgi:competence protein ComEA
MNVRFYNTARKTCVNPPHPREGLAGDAAGWPNAPESGMKLPESAPPNDAPSGSRPMLKTLLAAAAIGLAASAALAQPTPAPSTPAARPAPTMPTTPVNPTAPTATLIDVNSASRAELMTLPGIGEARADAIIRGRPYRGKDELPRKNIIPQGVYDNIQARIVARQR